MELLNKEEILSIAKICGFNNVISWCIEEFPNKVIGYLGDHLKLVIQVESKGIRTNLNLFIKCMPRLDKWKAQYLKELNFFKKEYVMLSKLFKDFRSIEASRKWRPKLLFIKEDIFVFENITTIGYSMPDHKETMPLEMLRAAVKSLARFHAESYIYEENKSKELGRPYRIWEDYSEYLQEPEQGMAWRNTGRNGVIDFLKVFSRFKAESNFSRHLDFIIPMLYDGALALMKPSSEYRNVVAHRDLWTNNILLKKCEDSYHAVLVDFQTVLYCSPMLDLSSLIFFNTTRSDRYNYTDELIDLYYDTISEELLIEDIQINEIMDKDTLIKAYNDSIMFGITQAALIVPIVSMTEEKRKQIFYDPENCKKANVVSRGEYFIEIAKEDASYRKRVLELFDEIIERYIYPHESSQHRPDKH